MNTFPQQMDLVFASKAHCRDCYRCLKSCPVKAIKIHKGQAYILADRCIDCNICIQNCAQNAISFKSDKSKVVDLLKSNKKLIISVDPSHSTIYSDWERRRLPSALRRLGFSFVSETAVAANIVAKRTMEYVAKHPERSHITSICPTVVNYVEKYRPELIDNLVPIASPYIVHARWLREKLGEDVVIIYVGACIAKKKEIERPVYSGLYDAVITFVELQEILKENSIFLKNCEESSFDETSIGKSRLLPLVGGLTAIAGKESNFLSLDILSVSGFQDLKNSLDLVATSKGVLVEPLFCYKGCINGPGLLSIKKNIFERRAELIDSVRTYEGIATENDLLIDANINLNINVDAEFYFDYIVPQLKFSDVAIQDVLGKTGHPNPDKRPNCFSCGYPTCRDKAIAVLEGMAEIEMCIPYMRRLAENKASLLIETTPNGVVVINEQFEIITMNNAFKKFFYASDSLVGKPISYLFDPEYFFRLAIEDLEQLEETTKYEKYNNIVCHQIFYKLKKEKQYVGIFINVTNNITNKTKLDALRETTIKQAQELLQHQVTMAQGIAKLLGDNTAKSEVLLNNLIRYTQNTQSSDSSTPFSLDSNE